MKRVSPKYYLVVVTAVGCGACNAFKENWPSMRSKLQSFIEIKEINQPRVTNVFDSKYPSGLDLYCLWFPTLLLVPKDDYDSMKVTRAYVFNGDIINGKAKMKSNRMDLNFINISNWIQNTI